MLCSRQRPALVVDTGGPSLGRVEGGDLRWRRRFPVLDPHHCCPSMGQAMVLVAHEDVSLGEAGVRQHWRPSASGEVVGMVSYFNSASTMASTESSTMASRWSQIVGEGVPAAVRMAYWSSGSLQELLRRRRWR